MRFFFVKDQSIEGWIEKEKAENKKLGGNKDCGMAFGGVRDQVCY